MISGCKLWADRSTFSIQTNNALETILFKKLPDHHGWLEDCGPTAAINVLEALGYETDTRSPKGSVIQPEDFLSIWMNDPKNYDLLRQARSDIRPEDYMCNEIPQYYTVALPRLFGANVEFFEGQSFEWIASMVQFGKGAMICLEKPGHFLAIVAYDDLTHEFIYRDSWPGRTGNDGFNLRMQKSEFVANVKPWLVLIS